jgi:hypothetical protein
MDKNKKEIKWTAPEYIFHEKSADWYWWVGTVAVFLIAISVYYGNWLFVAVIIIGGFSMVLYATRPPRIIEYSATIRGIKTDHQTYPYQSIEHFYISEHRNKEKEVLLLIKLRKTMEPLIILPLGDAPIDEIEDFLLNFIDEQEIGRPIGQTFMELIRF